MQKIQGKVTSWKWIGKQFGFPTANIFCNDENLAWGTRRYNVVIKNAKSKEKYNITQWNTILIPPFQAIGPYFPKQKLLEAHILEFQWNLYSKELLIYPLWKIRENQKLLNTNELIAQIQQDKKRVSNNPIKVITFGTFDKFHPWHKAYLTQARYWGDELITVVARDETVQQLKGHTPRQDEYTRLQQVQASWLVDYLVLWDVKNHYTVFQKYQPHIVCLGYDQHSFEKGIKTYCTQNNLIIPHIIRLDAYHPEKFKSSLIK